MIGHAFSAGLMVGRGAPPATFDATDKGPDVALSNGNLTVTWSQLSGYQSARTTSYKGQGRWFVEVNCGAQVDVGVCEVADYVASGPSVAGGMGIGYFNQTGSAAQVAIDLDARLMWRRASAAVDWNGNPSADPVTGVGGTDISSLVGDVYFAVSTSTHLNGPATANFGATPLTADPPYGYRPWTA